MDFNISKVYTQHIFQRIVVIDVFEFILLVLSLIVSFTVFYLFFSNGSLHIHLISSLIITGSFYLIAILCRLAILVGVFGEISQFDVDELFLFYGAAPLAHAGIFGLLQMIRGFSIAASVTAFVFVLYERILATLKYKTYENWKNLLVILKGIHPFYLMLVCAPIGCTGFVLLFGSYFYNLRKYNQYQKLHSYSLSHKFQLAENIRSIGLIWKGCLIVSINIGFASSLFLLSFLFQNSMLKYYCLVVFNYVIASVLISFILALLITDTWRDLFLSKTRSLMQIFMRGTNVADVNVALEHVKNLRGQRLVLPANEEQELYFQQLLNSWK